MMTQSEAGKGSNRRPTVNQRIADANWEIKEDGWIPMEIDPPGCAHEVKRFFNHHDPKVGRLYWRRIK